MGPPAMKELAPKKATYEDLYAIPQNMVGQIADGELITTPRPSYRHSFAGNILGTRLTSGFYFGEGGGPGGWVFFVEPEIMLGEDLLVPDLAGWRKERFPGAPRENWSTVPPDWICEILSPGTAGFDRIRKMPIYARHGVFHLWLIDPQEKTLEVFRLSQGKWLQIAAFAGNDPANAEPFLELQFQLGILWLD